MKVMFCDKDYSVMDVIYLVKQEYVLTENNQYIQILTLYC